MPLLVPAGLVLGALIVGLFAWGRAAAPAAKPAGKGKPPEKGPASGPSAAGLLLDAAKAGRLLPIRWVPVELPGGLTIEVTADALMAPAGGEGAVRLPVSYKDQVAIAKLLGAVSPTRAWWDATFKAAPIKIPPAPLPAGPQMGSLAYALKYSRSVDEAIQKRGGTPGESFARDVGKGWVLDPSISQKGAVNYGWIQPSNGVPIQSLGHGHNAAHHDYSQTAVLVKRMARRGGEAVDLLDELAASVPAEYLAPYR